VDWSGDGLFRQLGEPGEDPFPFSPEFSECDCELGKSTACGSKTLKKSSIFDFRNAA
jgi:hypothetical protein